MKFLLQEQIALCILKFHSLKDLSAFTFEVGFCSNLILLLLYVSRRHCCRSVRLTACQNKQLSCISSAAESQREISSHNVCRCCLTLPLSY